MSQPFVSQPFLVRRQRKYDRMPKTPVTITAVHLDTSYTIGGSGSTKVLVEIDNRWIEIMNETFDPRGFHISHICEGAGIAQRAKKEESQ